MASQAQATPQIVGHYYQFMERLDQTIEMQQGALAEVQRQREAARQVLLQAEIRMAGLHRVLERRRTELARAQERREQRQSDELAAQMHRRVARASENRGNS